jgi:fructose transport system ATP-binding protein
MQARSDAPVLEARDVKKNFGTVAALVGADFDLFEQEIVALVGDNGAGKSTLVKVLSGAIEPDEGQVLLDGNRVRFSSPIDARNAGIETVYQDLALAPHLDIASNLFLGREEQLPNLFGQLFRCLDKRHMRSKASEWLGELGINVGATDQLVEKLSGGQRQAIAVARAVSWGRRIVIMDEPTAALGVHQSVMVLELIRRIRDNGRSILLISHNLPEVFAVADRIQVMRLGRRVAEARPSTHTMDEVVAMITGVVEFKLASDGR